MEKTLISVREINGKLFIVINDEPLDTNSVKAVRVEIDPSSSRIEVDKIDTANPSCKKLRKETTEKFLFYR